jgi:hypothetical protein
VVVVDLGMEIVVVSHVEEVRWEGGRLVLCWECSQSRHNQLDGSPAEFASYCSKTTYKSNKTNLWIRIIILLILLDNKGAEALSLVWDFYIVFL